MALNCDGLLGADIQKDCLNRSQIGIEVNALIINFDDIDRSASVVDATNPLLITNIALVATKTGFFVEGIKQVYAPVGCKKCLKTGYIGRSAIFELLELTDEMRDVILNRPSIQDIRAITKRGLFNSLQESGYQLVGKGITSVDEIDRVAGLE